MGKRVKFSLDLNDVPPITDKERAELLRMSNDRGDGGIDFSDIPATTAEDWKNGVRGRFYRPVKEQVTLRIDAPTLDWFKQRTPKGYQTDINRVLGEYVDKQRKKAG